MAFVNLGAVVYSNSFETILGTEGGDDVLVTLTGNTGILGTSIGGVPGMSVGKSETAPFDDDDPIAMFDRPIAAVEMTITNTHGFVDPSTDTHRFDPSRDIPGEEFAIYVNGEKLTKAEMEAALSAGSAGVEGYAINDDGNLIKTDDDPSAIGTLVFEGFVEGIDDFQIDTVHQIDLPAINVLPNSSVVLAIDTAPFIPGFPDAEFGTPGNDDFEGTPDDDIYGALDGDDRAAGGAGDDALFGDDGNDTLIGNSGNDLLVGGEGEDKLFGRQDNDLLAGEEGNDRLAGQEGEDILLGGDDNDRLSGGDDDDIVAGNDGNDQIRGNFGDDIYIGGDGDDFLIGERGAEQFLFSATEDATEEQDIINAFDVNEDKLVISGFDIGDGDLQVPAAQFLEDNASIKGKNLIIKLGENHELKIKNIVDGAFAGAEPRDFADLILGDDEVDGGIVTEDDISGDPDDYLDLGDGYFLPLIPIVPDEEPPVDEDVDIVAL